MKICICRGTPRKFNAGSAAVTFSSPLQRALCHQDSRKYSLNAQVLWHETELVARGEGLVMSEKDDGKRLRCVATIDGLPSNVTVTTVTVRCQMCCDH